MMTNMPDVSCYWLTLGDFSLCCTLSRGEDAGVVSSSPRDWQSRYQSVESVQLTGIPLSMSGTNNWPGEDRNATKFAHL